MTLEVWSVLHGTTTIRRAMDLGVRRILFSAYSRIISRSGISETLIDEIRARDGRLFLDSGMISALRDRRKEWANAQERVVELARALKVDLVSSLDVPMEPWLLARGGWTSREALATTLRNARAFMDIDVGLAKKVFVLQGWTIDDYNESIQAFEDYGILDSRLGSNGRASRLAIGSVCRRKSNRGLWPVVEHLRRSTGRQWLHAFGTGDVSKLRRLATIGVNSVDSGNLVHRLIRSKYEDARKLVEAYGGYAI